MNGYPQIGSQSKADILVGLIGRDIQRSRSPEMHQQEARAQGLNLEYKLFDFAELQMGESDLSVFLEALQGFGYAGINVTHPYKQAVLPLLHEMSDGAARVGAVNTIAFRDGRRTGFNTDVTGFSESFRHGLPQAEVGRVFQAGAGGAGAATAYAMLDRGVELLVIHDQDEKRAHRLCEALGSSFAPERIELAKDLEQAVSTADGVINATPTGMAEHPGSAIPFDCLRQRQWVADVVYFPLNTALIQEARALGCRVLDGGGMAVYQAAGAFEVFTGRPANASRMRQQFLATITTAVPS